MFNKKNTHIQSDSTIFYNWAIVHSYVELPKVNTSPHQPIFNPVTLAEAALTSRHAHGATAAAHAARVIELCGAARTSALELPRLEQCPPQELGMENYPLVMADIAIENGHL